MTYTFKEIEVLTSGVLIEVFRHYHKADAYKELLDYLIKVVKNHPQEEYRIFCQAIFEHIVNNIDRDKVNNIE